MHKPAFLFIAAVLLSSCSHSSTESSSQASVATPAAVNYAPRIGVAVVTSSRTCVSIQNATVQPNSPVTLVNPMSPQVFVSAQISGPAANTCPITKEINPGWSSYEISASGSNLPKLTPLIAVLGNSTGFLMENVNVQADLDQNKSTDTFRACGANDGIHLTVWNGKPVTGTVLWRGYYYEEGNPGTLPTCSVTEAPAS